MIKEMLAAANDDNIDIYHFYNALSIQLKLHCTCVAQMTIKLLELAQDEQLEEALVLPADFSVLCAAVQFHDVGLALIPECLQNKVEELSSAETKVIQRHAAYGAKILERYRKEHTHLPEDETMWRIAADVALSHHERWDGRGYPYGQMATAVPITVRAVALADAYDSIVRGAAYRMALPHEYAILELADKAGTQFDPQLSKLFKQHETELRTISEAANNDYNQIIQLTGRSNYGT